jgi:hypothetical protein
VDFVIQPGLYFCSSQWKGSWLEPFVPFLRNVVYRKQIDAEKKRFDDYLWRLQDVVRTYFKLVTYMPEREGFEVYQKAGEA